MKKRTIAMVLVLVILAGLFGLAAYPDPGSELAYSDEATRNDTLSMTQEDYLKAVQDAFSKATTDEDKVKATCEAFLTLGKASVRNPKAYDCTALVDSGDLNQKTIQYRLSEFQYLTALYEVLGWEILWDDLAFSDFEASIDGDNATASVVESYSYYLNNDFDKVSFRRRMFNFELVLATDRWNIIDVTSSDIAESIDGFDYEPIDVEGVIETILSETKRASSTSVDENTKTDGQLAPRTELFFWPYDVAKAVSYAEAHYKDTETTPGLVFSFNKGNNCQNFASQCVWAGLGGEGTDTQAIPAVSIAELGGDEYAFNIWCHNQYTKLYSNPDLRWTWDNVCGFSKLLSLSTPSTEGPHGDAFYTMGVERAATGNVLTVDWQGSPAETTLNHAMFVTAVTGTYGQRTKYDVMIAAHTARTETAYQTVAEYSATVDTPISYFGVDYIYGGYYYFPE